MNKRGFTLLEISIVLVIIAMIIGAITIGSDLIRNSEIQSVYGESQRYVSAIKAFQDKYSALPGDFSNAQNLWPSAGVSCPTATVTGTCNGDGNGKIEGAEQFYAWQHLALAGMVEGTYTGATSGPGRVPGTNIPASQLTGAGWGLIYVDINASPGISYTAGDTLPGHVLWLGGRSTNGGDNEQNPVLTAEEAELMDRKIDDGLPDIGKIVAQTNSGTSCIAAGVYNVRVGGKICALVFKTGY